MLTYTFTYTCLLLAMSTHRQQTTYLSNKQVYYSQGTFFFYRERERERVCERESDFLTRALFPPGHSITDSNR